MGLRAWTVVFMTIVSIGRASTTIYVVSDSTSASCQNALLMEHTATVYGTCIATQAVPGLTLYLNNEGSGFVFGTGIQPPFWGIYKVTNCALSGNFDYSNTCPNLDNGGDLTDDHGPWCQQLSVNTSILFGCRAHFPTWGPSSAPTPPTARPSLTPTTQRPTKSPSQNPTTARPTRSPSQHPTTQRPTRSPSHNPTTTRPSATPTTARPSTSPSQNPTTTRPTRNPTLQPTTLSPTFDTQGCMPSSRMTKQHCRTLISKCGKVESKLKWTGKGCRTPKGAILGDGGCQCDGYCGYHCKKACSKDRQCRWVDNSCLVKATRLPGGPITQC